MTKDVTYIIYVQYDNNSEIITGSDIEEAIVGLTQFNGIDITGMHVEVKDD